MTFDPAPLRARLAEVRAKVDAAARAAGRDPSEVALVAVSKFQPEEAVRAAYDAGQRLFGENYAQELVRKSAALADLPGLRFHFIGTLQRNKARDVVPRAAMVEVVDREELARELDRRAAEAGRPLDVLLEVNLAGEAAKGGVAPEGVPALAAAVRACPHLALRGLMAIPPDVDHPEQARPHFARLRALARAEGLSVLSMGMSHDFEVAIAEGATQVRVGTAIFGPRPAAPR